VKRPTERLRRKVSFRLSYTEKDELIKHAPDGLSAMCRDAVRKAVQTTPIKDPMTRVLMEEFDAEARRGVKATVQFLLCDSDYIALLNAVGEWSVSDWVRAVVLSRLDAERAA
jgi:hypothetical protein